MKKLIALIAVIGFISFKSASAQTDKKSNNANVTTEWKAADAEKKADASKEMKSCHGSAEKSCCKNKSKKSCCSMHGTEKAEAKDDQKEKVKGDGSQQPIMIELTLSLVASTCILCSPPQDLSHADPRRTPKMQKAQP